MKSKSILVPTDHFVFRYGGGSFIAVWRVSRANEHVPDDMIPVPESLKKSHIVIRDIENVAKEYTASCIFPSGLKEQVPS